jgi:hypothetical protein
MLLVFLKKGLCGGGCGDLGKIYSTVEIHFGPGTPYLAECKFGEVSAFCFTKSTAKYCPRDYLVIRLFTGEDYDPAQLTDEVLDKYRERLRAIARELREASYAAFLTRRPYHAEFTIGSAILPSDIVEILHTEESPCGKLLSSIARIDIAKAELLPLR